MSDRQECGILAAILIVGGFSSHDHLSAIAMHVMGIAFLICASVLSMKELK